MECSRNTKEASVAGAEFTRGRIKEMIVREVWDVGPVGSLHFITCTLIFIVNVVRTSRGCVFVSRRAISILFRSPGGSWP